VNVSLLLAIGTLIVTGGLGWVSLRYVIRKDRADGAASAQAELDRQDEDRRRAVADAVRPKDEQITEQRTQIAEQRIKIRDRDLRIQQLEDRLYGQTQGGQG
jgi:hypothetical protein